MTALFMDTAGWMACADASDPAHEACRAARDTALRAGQAIVTTDYVVDETLTLIRLRLSLAAAEAWWRQVDSSQRVRWERIDPGRFDRALELFFRHRDKAYSFTDCTSLALMRELKITSVLTTDKHFKQMGFDVLPGGRRLKRRQ
jgi:predicted nucleic acid-binding protein